MPTHEETQQFWRDYWSLTPPQREAFRVAVRRFVTDLRTGRFRAGLRVRGVQGSEGVFEMTWAPDGRATFHYGRSLRPGDPHIIW